MLYNIENSPEAELDIQNAADYYDAISIELGNRFEDELYATYKKITNNPQFYKYLSNKQERKLKCARLKSFPYIVIYRIHGNTIIVISFFNTHCKPRYGQP